MANFQAFNQFTEDLCKGVHQFGTHTFKYAFTNTAPTLATNTVFADLTEIGAGNGYVAGGITLTGVSAEQTAGVVPLLTDDKTLTAAGGPIGPFRYVVLYNDTASGKPLVGMWDRGSSITLSDTDSVVLDADGVNGLFTVDVV